MFSRRLTQLALLSILWAAPAAAQSGPMAVGDGAAGGAEGTEAGEVDLSHTALARGRYAVVIDLDDNTLSFRKGDVTLWSAPVGTGTALWLNTGKKQYDFATPNGIFHVQYKELNPVWIAPDWFFVENGLPVPPPNDKKRYYPGGLGAAAVYIDHDLAIHGTDKPELLGQRVSHGCIRLSNRDALRLFHNVQVGTEVIIVGGRDIERRTVRPGEVKSTFTPDEKPPKDPELEGWKAMPTEELLGVLDDELWLDEESSRWPEVAGLLLDRGLEDDDEALVGLLEQSRSLPDEAARREYGTFLADAFARGPLRTTQMLAELSTSTRRRAARAIVEATMELYHGDFDDAAAPWPTRRVPAAAVDDDAQPGWNALARAEREFRE
jgi:lipoprotein-anchoring transpeptidase ErfK/SrfK